MAGGEASLSERAASVMVDGCGKSGTLFALSLRAYLRGLNSSDGEARFAISTDSGCCQSGRSGRNPASCRGVWASVRSVIVVACLLLSFSAERGVSARCCASIRGSVRGVSDRGLVCGGSTTRGLAGC